MKITQTKELTAAQQQQINQLWNEEYPVNLKDRFGILLDGVANYQHYLIENSEKNIVAWAVAFEKDDEVRFSIIVGSKHQGKGLGRSMVNQLKEDLEDFYGWVIDHNDDKKENGQYYQSPLAFYKNHGFEILHDQRMDNGILKAVKIKRTKGA